MTVPANYGTEYSMLFPLRYGTVLHVAIRIQLHPLVAILETYTRF